MLHVARHTGVARRIWHLNFDFLKVHHRMQHVRTPAEMRGAFPFKETSATPYYSGPLTIADTMTIEVKAGRTTALAFFHRCACTGAVNALAMTSS